MNAAQLYIIPGNQPTNILGGGPSSARPRQTTLQRRAERRSALRSTAPVGAPQTPVEPGLNPARAGGTLWRAPRAALKGGSTGATSRGAQHFALRPRRAIAPVASTSAWVFSVSSVRASLRPLCETLAFTPRPRRKTSQRSRENRLPGAAVVKPYSYRSATMGSTFIARRAGI